MSAARVVRSCWRWWVQCWHVARPRPDSTTLSPQRHPSQTVALPGPPSGMPTMKKRICLSTICLLSCVLSASCGSALPPGPDSTIAPTTTAGPIRTPEGAPAPDLTPSPTPGLTSLPAPTATGSASATPAPTPAEESYESGLEGQVLRGPVCPGPERLNSPCPDQPFSATFLALDGQENKVALFRTDEQGRFRVALPPGRYAIVPEESAPIMRPGGQRKEVTVAEGEFTQVTLVFDTGIR